MASAVDICNLALSHLGEAGTVSAITPPDGSAEARACARFYPIARDIALCHPRAAWGFATKRVTLSQLEDAEPPATWLYAFGLPSDFGRAIKVLIPGSADELDAQQFDIEALEDGTVVLYANFEDPTLVYIAKITDTTKFSPLFVDAVSFLLASYLVGPIAKDKALKESMLSAFKMSLVDAAAADSHGRKAAGYGTFTPAALKARG